MAWIFLLLLAQLLGAYQPSPLFHTRSPQPRRLFSAPAQEEQTTTAEAEASPTVLLEEEAESSVESPAAEAEADATALSDEAEAAVPAEEEEEEVVEIVDPREELKSRIADLEARVKEKRLELRAASSRAEQSGKRGYYQLAAQIDQYKRNNKAGDAVTAEEQKAELFRSFVPVLDGFEDLNDELKPEIERERKMHKDFQELYRAMMDKLTGMGMEQFHATPGVIFDDSLHVAVGYVDPPPGVNANAVVEEKKPGFILNGALIRKVSCVVAKTTTNDGDDAAAGGPSLEKTNGDQSAGDVDDAAPAAAEENTPGGGEDDSSPQEKES